MKAEWLDRSLITGPFVCLCITEAQFHQVLKGLGIPKADYPAFLCSGTADASCHFVQNRKDKSTASIVTLRNAPKISKIQKYALLVHEAVHIWQEYRHGIGEKSPSAEFEAYSVQAISQKLMLAFDKLTAKKRATK